VRAELLTNRTAADGRVGRFLMNTMMASGGYPWTVIPVTDRNAYVNALEKASVGENIARPSGTSSPGWRKNDWRASPCRRCRKLRP